MDALTKRVLKIPKEEDFDDAYDKYRLWIFFRETADDIYLMFRTIRGKMKKARNLEKKHDP